MALSTSIGAPTSTASPTLAMRSTNPRHRRAHAARPVHRFGAHDARRLRGAVVDLDGARHAVEVEVDLARALLGVELAHCDELDAERLALLQLDGDLLAQLHRLDVRA